MPFQISFVDIEQREVSNYWLGEPQREIAQTLKGAKAAIRREWEIVAEKCGGKKEATDEFAGQLFVCRKVGDRKIAAVFSIGESGPVQLGYG